MSISVYLAARFSRLPELLEHKSDLEFAGITVTSRWLLGGHEWVGTADEDIPVTRNAKFARDDLDDIDKSNIVVCFTEPAKSAPARGGRHFEAGYAFATGKPILVVGYVENVFYALPAITKVDNWPDALAWLWNAHLKDTRTPVDEIEGVA